MRPIYKKIRLKFTVKIEKACQKRSPIEIRKGQGEIIPHAPIGQIFKNRGEKITLGHLTRKKCPRRRKRRKFRQLCLRLSKRPHQR